MKTALLLSALALLSAFQDAPAAAPDFAAEVKALRAEYQKAQREFVKAYQAAKTTEERKALTPPDADYLAKFQELAEKAKGTEAGAEALLEVFGLAQRSQKKDVAKGAIDTLVADHIKSPLMERLANNLRYAGYYIGNETCQDALKTILEKSPLPKAKAAAVFILAVQGMEGKAEESRTAFIRLKKEFADTPYAERADAFLFELDNLQVGKTAPDFDATDEKGVKYKLSDYRGKVTVIDFWGFW